MDFYEAVEAYQDAPVWAKRMWLNVLYAQAKASPEGEKQRRMRALLGAVDLPWWEWDRNPFVDPYTGEPFPEEEEEEKGGYDPGLVRLGKQVREHPYKDGSVIVKRKLLPDGRVSEPLEVKQLTFEECRFQFGQAIRGSDDGLALLEAEFEQEVAETSLTEDADDYTPQLIERHWAEPVHKRLYLDDEYLQPYLEAARVKLMARGCRDEREIRELATKNALMDVWLKPGMFTKLWGENIYMDQKVELFERYEWMFNESEKRLILSKNLKLARELEDAQRDYDVDEMTNPVDTTYLPPVDWRSVRDLVDRWDQEIVQNIKETLPAWVRWYNSLPDEEKGYRLGDGSVVRDLSKFMYGSLAWNLARYQAMQDFSLSAAEVREIAWRAYQREREQRRSVWSSRGRVAPVQKIALSAMTLRGLKTDKGGLILWRQVPKMKHLLDIGEEGWRKIVDYLSARDVPEKEVVLACITGSSTA